jgi:FkbM family methyltransferase
MLYHPEYDIWYLGHGDPYVFTEQRRDYGRVAERAKDAVVLDFGAHCGFFNVYLNRNYPPKKIISVEPDKRMFEVLLKNINTENTKLIMSAVVDQEFPALFIPLYLGKTFSATNSIEPFRGREEVQVPVVHFQDLLREGVEFIKCDCEGGEYSLNWSDLPSLVHTIAIEFHFHRSDWHSRMVSINRTLKDQGFSVVKQPKLNTFQKVSTGLYVRE